VTKKKKIPPLPQIKGQLPSSHAFILTKELPRLLAEPQKNGKEVGFNHERIKQYYYTITLTPREKGVDQRLEG
jgi:hypothetical protein